MGLGTGEFGLDAAKEAADRGMRRFTGMLRAGVDSTARVSNEWTVRDAAAHVAGTLPLYVDMAGGKPSPVRAFEQLAAYNERFLSVEEHNVYAFADAIDRAMADLMDVLEHQRDDFPVTWHAGVVLPLSTVVGLLGGEGYLHGYDVARAARMSWEIPNEDAVTVIRAALPLFPHIVDPARARDLIGTVEVRLRGVEDGRWAFTFSAGGLTVEPADTRHADWTMSSAPVAYLLAAYGRLSPAKAMLTGQVVGWGRRPTLGLRFGKAFLSF